MFMTKILIVTKNLLAEQEIQAALQRSNDEVYCSVSLMYKAEFCPQVIRHFSIVIFSDTISTKEFSKYYSHFKDNGLLIIRKGDREYLQASDYAILYEDIDEWIDLHSSTAEIVERLAELKNEQIQSIPTLEFEKMGAEIETESKRFLLCLSTNERKLLHYLYQANGETLSRERICQLIWEKEPSSSELSQLSSLANRIRIKLDAHNIDKDELITTWSKGYSLGEHLLDILRHSPSLIKAPK